jgi:hypothetical protein
MLFFGQRDVVTAMLQPTVSKSAKLLSCEGRSTSHMKAVPRNPAVPRNLHISSSVTLPSAGNCSPSICRRGFMQGRLETTCLIESEMT